MKAFEKQLVALSEKYPLPEELARLRPGAAAYETLSRARAASDLERFALSLPGGELDALLPLSGEDLSDADLDILCGLLAFRATPRLARHFWPVWQYCFEKPAASRVALVFLNNCGEDPACANLKRVLSPDGIDGILQKMSETFVYIRTFFVSEGILPESPFARNLTARYFMLVGKEGFMLNEKAVADLLPICPHDEQKGIIIRYLSVLSEEEYVYKINDLILSLWGGPYTSADWHGVDDKLRRKFLNWESLRLLREHFKTKKKKLGLLSLFIPYFRDIRFHASAISVDFGEFVVVDTDETSPFSYYLKKDLFETVLPELDQTGDIDSLRKRKKLPGAREYILEELEDSFMQLSYADVGRLYIVDMLKILLGASPDLRRSKRISSTKKPKVTFKQ